MTDINEKILFTVVATIGEGERSYRRPYFVRAATLREAYVEVLQGELFQNPAVKLEAFVVGTGELAKGLRLEDLAKFYWSVGRNTSETFEDAWDENGAEPWDNESETP